MIYLNEKSRYDIKIDGKVTKNYNFIYKCVMMKQDKLDNKRMFNR